MELKIQPVKIAKTERVVNLRHPELAICFFLKTKIELVDARVEQQDFEKFANFKIPFSIISWKFYNLIKFTQKLYQPRCQFCTFPIKFKQRNVILKYYLSTSFLPELIKLLTTHKTSFFFRIH